MNETKYELNDEQCIFKVDIRIYSLKILMKAAYIYIDNMYIFFEYEDENFIKVIFTLKDKRRSDMIERCVGEFFNELLHQKIRASVSDETKNLRSIILARALYGTALEMNDHNGNNEIDKVNDDYLSDQDEIAISWFEKNSKEG